MPEGSEKYIPTKEDMQSAESRMTDEMKEESKERSQIYKSAATLANKLVFSLAINSEGDKSKEFAEDLIEIAIDLDPDFNKENDAKITSILETKGVRKDMIPMLVQDRRLFFQECKDELTKYSQLVKDIEYQFEEAGGFDKDISNLDNEQLKKHIILREKLIHLAFLTEEEKDTKDGRQKLTNRMYMAFQGEDPSDEPESPYAEQEIIYPIFLSASFENSKQFLNLMREVIVNFADDYEIKRHISVIPKGCFDFLHRQIRKARAKKLSRLTKNALEGKRIFEVGGSSAVKFISEHWGAEKTQEADQGHVGYEADPSLVALQANNQNIEGMITIANYKQHTESGSADIVCSSRLFDVGSGLHKIAEPAEYSENPDLLGEKEMILIMSNIAKDNGFLVHFDAMIDEKYARKCGWTKILNTEIFSSKGTNVYRFRGEDKDPNFNYVKLGKKEIEFNPETQTWELKK